MAELQSVPTPGSQSTPDQIRDQDKIMLVLAYFGILALIPLLTVKDSAYVKFHARQGITLFGLYIAWLIVATVLSFVPVVNVIVWLLSMVVALGYIAVSILGIVKAFGGERWRLPVVSDLAEKLPV